MIFFCPASERKRSKDGERERKREKHGKRNSHAPHRESERNALDGVEERQEGHGRELVAERQQEGLRFFFLSF